MGNQKRTRRSNSLMEHNWSKDLPEDLIISIAKWLYSLEDFIFFGAVCKSWRSATTKLVKEKKYTNTTGIGSRLLTQQVPLLMLPLAFCEMNCLNLSLSNKKVGFYSPGKGEISYKLDLPREKMTTCVSSLGWLMIVSGANGGRWNLLHPLTLAKIELPDGGAHLPGVIEKFALSSSPSWTSDYVVMFHTRYSLRFYRPGLGENWKTINLLGDAIMDVVYYKGQFYFLYFSGCVSVFDIDKEEIRVVAPEFPKGQLLGPNVRTSNRYLVESAGVLLVVLFTANMTNFEDEASTYGCRVFEVPFTNSKSWSHSEVRSLGNRTIFLSKCSSSFSIEASDYSGSCKPNSIYFMNNKIVLPRQSRDMGVYNMKDRTITRDFDKFFNYEESRGFHLWIQPSL